MKPGDTVIDYLPGKGYWTRIFSGVVGPKGRVFAYWPAAAQKYAEGTLGALQGRNLANVTAQVQGVNLPAAEQPVDLFWTVQNYHDVANKNAGEPALRAFDQAVFKALKPGGTYIIIDHADAVGKGWPTPIPPTGSTPITSSGRSSRSAFASSARARCCAIRRTTIPRTSSTRLFAGGPTSLSTSSASPEASRAGRSVSVRPLALPSPSRLREGAGPA
ncbi:hypothetical protein P0F65_14595 [Sphingomonas sp. I4]